VDVSGAVHIGGPIARVGQRLIGSASRMMLDRFFACLRSKVEATAGGG
jgi:carbon monoxide dehydrogenase subunit G